jgi:hypothetical protein
VLCYVDPDVTSEAPLSYMNVMELRGLESPTPTLPGPGKKREQGMNLGAGVVEHQRCLQQALRQGSLWINSHRLVEGIRDNLPAKVRQVC